MKKNGVEVVHLDAGLPVGSSPCPYIDDFRKSIEERYGMEVVLGTHPISKNYYETHDVLGTWAGQEWQSRLQETLTDEATRRSYD